MARAAIETIILLAFIAGAWWWYNDTIRMKTDYESAIVQLNENIASLNRSHAKNLRESNAKKERFNVTSIDKLVQADDPGPAVKRFTVDTNRVFMDAMDRHRKFAMREDSPDLSRRTPGTW